LAFCRAQAIVGEDGFVDGGKGEVVGKGRVMFVPIYNVVLCVRALQRTDPTRGSERYPVKQLIGMLIPNNVFSHIKMGPNAKEVWDTLKDLYKSHTEIILVNLLQHLQSA
jgi:hypothetical protein